MGGLRWQAPPGSVLFVRLAWRPPLQRSGFSWPCRLILFGAGTGTRRCAARSALAAWVVGARSCSCLWILTSAFQRPSWPASCQGYAASTTSPLPGIHAAHRVSADTDDPRLSDHDLYVVDVEERSSRPESEWLTVSGPITRSQHARLWLMRTREKIYLAVVSEGDGTTSRSSDWPWR